MSALTAAWLIGPSPVAAADVFFADTIGIVHSSTSGFGREVSILAVGVAKHALVGVVFGEDEAKYIELEAGIQRFNDFDISSRGEYNFFGIIGGGPRWHEAGTGWQVTLSGGILLIPVIPFARHSVLPERTDPGLALSDDREMRAKTEVGIMVKIPVLTLFAWMSQF
jgi:hypothetical protein